MLMVKIRLLNLIHENLDRFALFLTARQGSNDAFSAAFSSKMLFLPERALTLPCRHFGRTPTPTNLKISTPPYRHRGSAEPKSSPFCVALTAV